VLNARQTQGQTALAISTRSPGNGEDAALLLQAGASPFIPNNLGFLPVLNAQIAHNPVLQRRFEEAMGEPERVWRLAQARAVLDARQALQGVLEVGGEEEEDMQEGGGEEEQGAKEGGILTMNEILKVVSL